MVPNKETVTKVRINCQAERIAARVLEALLLEADNISTRLNVTTLRGFGLLRQSWLIRKLRMMSEVLKWTIQIPNNLLTNQPLTYPNG